MCTVNGHKERKTLVEAFSSHGPPVLSLLTVCVFLCDLVRRM